MSSIAAQMHSFIPPSDPSPPCSIDSGYSTFPNSAASSHTSCASYYLPKGAQHPDPSRAPQRLDLVFSPSPSPDPASSWKLHFRGFRKLARWVSVKNKPESTAAVLSRKEELRIYQLPTTIHQKNLPQPPPSTPPRQLSTSISLCDHVIGSITANPSYTSLENAQPTFLDNLSPGQLSYLYTRSDLGHGTNETFSNQTWLSDNHQQTSSPPSAFIKYVSSSRQRPRRKLTKKSKEARAKTC